MNDRAKAGKAARAASAAGYAERRSAARLAAIQALYQIEIAGAAPEAVLLEFLEHRLEEELEGVKLGSLDRALFSEVVRGARERRGELDDMISALLAEGWTVERLEMLLRIILEAGAWELAYRQATPARVIVNEYVGLAHAFFEPKEAGMANGILDGIARSLRSEEFEGS